jgi:nicotinate-nucleotide--dimethylbenzimidazole phosphoribosyltransferase
MVRLLNKTVRGIRPVDHSREAGIRFRLDNLIKPPGSLGYLEELAVRYCLATGTSTPTLGKKLIVVFAGDHGVAAEGISAYPQEVTAQMVKTMARGGAAVNVLSRHAGVETRVVDIGVAGSLENLPEVIIRKIRQGAANITAGPALSLEDTMEAVEVGIDLALEAADDGAALIGTGEMGIANTTPSSAIFAALLPCAVEDVTGRGTGIDEDRLRHKIMIIKRALAVNRERLTDPLNTLAAVGGLEIAGICGLILGAVFCRRPVVVDGFISTAAALVVCKMCPHAADYLFFSHLSAETGHAVFFDTYKIRPILDLGMHLGEGTGAALAMFVIEAAVKIYNEMATFEAAGVSKKGD